MFEPEKMRVKSNAFRPVVDRKDEMIEFHRASSAFLRRLAAYGGGEALG